MNLVSGYGVALTLSNHRGCLHTVIMRWRCPSRMGWWVCLRSTVGYPVVNPWS